MQTRVGKTVNVRQPVPAPVSSQNFWSPALNIFKILKYAVYRKNFN